MEENKISAIKKMNAIKAEIIESVYDDYPKKLEFLENAYQISLNAPLRITTSEEGVRTNNREERAILLQTLRHDIEFTQTMKPLNFNGWKFQVVSTIIQLMVSITDRGIYEIDEILNK